MPISIIIVEKTGVIKSQTIKEYKEDELYKKAGFKSGDGFEDRTNWNVDINDQKYSIHVFGKISGRAGQENKYDFPPPIDNTLFFGACILVNKSESGDAVNLSSKEWEAIYEHLFGGFEDLGDEDTSDDEDDEDADIPRTKEGYAKDGFVVDDDAVEDDDYEETSEDEDDDDDGSDDDSAAARKKKKAKKTLAKKTKTTKAKKEIVAKSTKTKGSKIPQNVFIMNENVENNGTFLDCTSELCEEAYL